jgi:ferric-dicitrate binding protein FerR (iron transport regulator)
MTKPRDDVERRANEIEQQAAEWVARIDVGATPEERAALDAWLAANPRHRAAYLRLAAAWRRADQLKGLRPGSGTVDPDLLEMGSEDASSDSEATFPAFIAEVGAALVRCLMLLMSLAAVQVLATCVDGNSILHIFRDTVRLTATGLMWCAALLFLLLVLRAALRVMSAPFTAARDE